MLHEHIHGGMIGGSIGISWIVSETGLRDENIKTKLVLPWCR